MLSKVRRVDFAAIARNPRVRGWGRRFAVFMIVVGVLGFLALPPVLKAVLVSRLGEALQREVAIESISLNPYTLTLSVAGVSVRDRAEGRAGDEVFGFDRLTVNAELASLAVAGVIVKEVELIGPRVNLVRLADNRYNISDLIPAAEERKPEEKSGLPRFSVSNIQIRGGRLTFDDRPEGVKHEIADLTLSIPFLSTLSYYSDTYVEPHFSASINGAPLVLQGRSRPFADSRESELTLAIDNLQLARYLTYAPVDLPIRAPSGVLDGDLRLRFVQGKGQPSAFSLAGSLALKELKIEETGGARLLALKRLGIRLREVDLLKPSVAIERVELESPEVDLRFSKDGTLNWLNLMPSQRAEQAKPSAPGGDPKPALYVMVDTLSMTGGVLSLLEQSAQAAASERLQIEKIEIKEGRLDLGKREVLIGEYVAEGARASIVRRRDGGFLWERPAAQHPTKAAGADNQADRAAARGKGDSWQVTVARARVRDHQLLFEDRRFATPARQTVEISALSVENLSTQAGAEAKLDLALRINGKGELAVAGALQPMQPQGELHVQARDIGLLPLQPYFSEMLDLTVTRGLVTADGNLSFAPGSEGIAAQYKGNLTLGNFHSLDKANAADFLKWKSLYFGNIDVKTAPLDISVGEVALSDFYARVILSAEGKLNLLQIARRDKAEADKGTEAKPAGADGEAAAAELPVADVAAAPAAPAAPARAAVPTKVGKVTVQGGNINFTDNFIKPNYSANLTKIGGRVTGLSSAEGALADLELRGSYDGQAPVNIVAKLNPFAAKSYLDLDAEVKGVDMAGLSTYSGKYAGYEIERGKLSLFLKYKIENNQLVADNRLFLDQLTFGDEVDTHGVSKLPVRLAVALLQNRRGEIDINLPISGSLDDPQFSLGGIIVQVILNVFTKAITSPFALIGSLFGGGEELSYVEFDYGYATISPAMRERLQTVARVLEDRPAIRIEIAGRVDPERDREGLKRALMERRVKAQRLEELVKAGTEVDSLDAVQIPDKDYPKYLERAYKAEKFPKPRNLIGLVKDLPVEEMEKLMMANMKADDEALRDLAVRRGIAVVNWLTGEGRIPAERVFQLQPNLTAKDGPQNDKAKESRADFTLK